MIFLCRRTTTHISDNGKIKSIFCSDWFEDDKEEVANAASIWKYMTQLTIANTAKSEFTFFIGLHNFCLEEIVREIPEESFPPAIESHIYIGTMRVQDLF